MLSNRRPTKLRRIGLARKTPRCLNFPQMHREVALLSDIGMIIKESRQFRVWQSLRNEPRR